MTESSEPAPDAEQHGSVVHPSSGPNSPSPPRRPGTGARQGRDAEETTGPWMPGQIVYDDNPVLINADKPVTTLRVRNTADRPIQVGSHFHFAEVNAALEFDRDSAWGKRLNVLSGGMVRFEPGAVNEVELIPIGGRRIVPGLRGLCRGALDG